MKRLFIYIPLILCLVSCQPKEDDDSKNQSKKVVALANRIALVNTIEDTIELLDKKEYIKTEEKLKEIFDASNKVSYTYNSVDKECMAYINTLNQFATAINQASTKAKENKIEYDYQKSMLALMAEIENKEQSNKEESKDSSSDSENLEEESTSNGESGADDKKTSNIVIPEEATLKEFPEITRTREDDLTKHQLITLLNYTTKESIILYPDNEKIIYNRIKSLFYQINSLCKLNEYNKAAAYGNELVLQWQKIYNNLDEKDSSETKQIAASITNIQNAINKKDYIAIKTQSTSSIEAIKTLANKKGK